jgi:calcium channel MID1
MLPETLLCLLNAAFILAQGPQKLSLNNISSFNPSNTPNPPLFSLPQSKNLSITVALCSGTSQTPRFFVSNSSSIGASGSGGSQITITSGHGQWIGPVSNGGVLSVANAGQSSFELAVSEDGAFLVMRDINTNS